MLQLIRDLGPLSRADLARESGLSRPAVSDLIRELLTDGLVQESGPVPSAAGRKPVLVSMAYDGRQVIGIELGDSTVQGILVNLRAQVLRRAQAAVDADAPQGALWEVLDQLVLAATSPVLGVGIGAPGLVDAAEGLVHYAALPIWEGLPLTRLVQERYGLPALVDNDTSLTALGEYTYGAGRGTAPLAVLTLGTGIGAGLIIDGRIYPGANGWSGEVGHLAVPGATERCRCGRIGCLETVASVPEILRRAGIDATAEAGLNGLASRAAGGDAEATALIREVGRSVGHALVALVHTFNPRRVLLGGTAACLGSLLLDAVTVGLQEMALPALTAVTEIEMAELGRDGGLLGAAALVALQEIGIA